MGKGFVWVSAAEITVYELLRIGASEPISLWETLFIDLRKGFKMNFHTPVIIRRLRISRKINGCGSKHDFSPLEK
jgi:hypothetical protein